MEYCLKKTIFFTQEKVIYLRPDTIECQTQCYWYTARNALNTECMVLRNKLSLNICITKTAKIPNT